MAVTAFAFPWQALADAGMLRRALVKQRGKPAATVWVGYEEPATMRFGGARSIDYQIEYQFADLPFLVEGDSVTLLDNSDIPVPKQKFVVRESPFVSDIPAQGSDGTYRRALLTRDT